MATTVLDSRGAGFADETSAGLTGEARLRASYRACRELTRRTAGNFGYTFLPLPAERRRQMEAVYAFMRICDDLADDETVSREDRAGRLADWRDDVTAALAGGAVADPYLPAIADVVRRRAIPHVYLFEVIAGVTSDLAPRQPADLGELEAYCYRVAGAVGLCCIHVWGFDAGSRDEAVAAAVDCGLALQLTNILRDVREDAENGRVYLPADECGRFGVTADTFLAGEPTAGFEDVMRFQIVRAREAYLRGRRLLPLLDPCGRPVLRAMLRLYGSILERIAADPSAVLRGRVALPKWRKAGIAAGAMLGF